MLRKIVIVVLRASDLHPQSDDQAHCQTQRLQTKRHQDVELFSYCLSLGVRPGWAQRPCSSQQCCERWAENHRSTSSMIMATPLTKGITNIVPLALTLPTTQHLPIFTYKPKGYTSQSGPVPSSPGSRTSAAAGGRTSPTALSRTYAAAGSRTSATAGGRASAIASAIAGSRTSVICRLRKLTR
jgi:hypothetical protein